ncbi:hypothetical protein [Haladaptatus sp. DJG-WS-42]|uniref:hypothetical protein n=1 Tax=Haladaptatus sp. DJG-WS-42 TaxID=3120516 RepID=UPI0030D236F1
MALRTRRNQPIDPVPFLVVLCTAFLLIFSAGPVYALSLGASVYAAVGASILVFLGCGAVIYYQMVWVARPELAGEVPAQVVLERHFYGVIAVLLVMVLLSLPFL